MDALKYPAWEKLYHAAIQGTDSEKLTALVFEAEDAIFERMLVLCSAPDRREELRAIEDACQRLFDIKTKILKWPNPYVESKQSQAPSQHGKQQPAPN